MTSARCQDLNGSIFSFCWIHEIPVDCQAGWCGPWSGQSAVPVRLSLSLSLSLSRSSPRLSAVVRWAPCRQDVTGLALTSSQATPHRYWLATCRANCLFRKLSTMISIWISDMSGAANWNRWRWPKSCWLLMFPSSSCCVWMTENKIKSWIDISWCQSRHYRHLVTWWVKINY